MELIGLGFNFLGGSILGFNAWATSSHPQFARTWQDRLTKPLVTVVGLGIMTIGFGLQFVAILLSGR